MARTAITPQQASATGLALNFEAANTDGNSFKLAAGRAIRVRNASAGAVTVTIPSTATVDGLVVPNRTVNVPATTGDVYIALGQAAAPRQSDGSVWINYSAVASVTVAVIDVP